MQKPKVVLEKSIHKENPVVKILFDKNDEILRVLKALPLLRWSQTMVCWYLPYSSTTVKEVFDLLRSIAFIDYSSLKRVEEGTELTPVILKTQQIKIKESPNKQLPDLNDNIRGNVDSFTSWMRSRRYSENTTGTYTEALSVFLRFFHHKSAEDITNEDLIEFNNQYIIANHLSSSYQNQVVNAIKLFFRTIQKRSMDIDLVHRPKRAKTLPNVLSKEEVKQILTALTNVKHRVMLSLIYSCGLRRGELLNLKLGDIDSKRGLIIIRRAKGKKDRVVPLSEKILFHLRDYFLAYKPKIWLFEGQGGGVPYDERSLASILTHALAKTNIKKPVTLHWLRHSYATHLLENGTDLRYIQEILGHSRSTTTEIYTHVSNKSIQKVVSPFDSL